MTADQIPDRVLMRELDRWEHKRKRPETCDCGEYMERHGNKWICPNCDEPKRKGGGRGGFFMRALALRCGKQ